MPYVEITDCDCEYDAHFISFRLNDTEYVCEWDDVHPISHIVWE